MKSKLYAESFMFCMFANHLLLEARDERLVAPKAEKHVSEEIKNCILKKWQEELNLKAQPALINYKNSLKMSVPNIRLFDIVTGLIIAI